MDRLEQQVEMWISDHKEELLADIQKLVRHRSISEKRPKEPVYGQGCKDVLEEMLSLGKRYGFKVENADDVCGVISYEGGERSIGLWGHLDVVPEGGQWEYPPYECTQVGDFLIGRGVQDNKGPCIAALYVLRCLKELQIPFSHTLIQIVGCAEETGMEDVVRYTAQFPVPDYNIITDCGFPVCYGEKGILEARLRSDKAFSSRIVDFYGGSVSNIVPDHASLTLYGCQVLPEAFKDLPEWITIEQKEDLLVLNAKGISAHAAFPDGGINAVSRLCNAMKKTQLLVGEDLKILSFLQELSGNTDGSALGIACQDEESGALTSVCGVARLDDGHLEIEMNIRYPITADSEKLQENITKQCKARGFQPVRLDVNRPNYQDKNSVFVRTLNDSYNEITGQDKPPFVMGGGTYARKLPNAVAFGPGLPADLSPLGLPQGHGGCHSPDEAQSIPNLLLALKIYVLSLIRLDKALS